VADPPFKLYSSRTDKPISEELRGELQTSGVSVNEFSTSLSKIVSNQMILSAYYLVSRGLCNKILIELFFVICSGRSDICPR
jgi:hypothetical protein